MIMSVRLFVAVATIAVLASPLDTGLGSEFLVSSAHADSRLRTLID
jgi:hypothetical protein